MSAAILHVLYRVRHESGGRRSACLADVHGFMSLGAEDPENLELGDGGKDDDSFNSLLDDMTVFDHGDPVVNAEVSRAAGGQPASPMYPALCLSVPKTLRN